MNKIVQKAIFVVLLLSSAIMQAQQIHTGKFTYWGYPYGFCIENYEVSFPIPQDWGFNAPYSQKENTLLTMSSKYVNYDTDFDEIDSAVIAFSAGNGEACLELLIFPRYLKEEEITNPRLSFDPVLRATPLFIAADDSGKLYQHTISDALFVFRILTENKAEIEQCRGIIENATPYESNLKLHKLACKTGQKTYFPAIGLTFTIPADGILNTWTKYVSYDRTGTKLTADISLNNIVRKHQIARIETPEIDFSCAVYKKNDTEKPDKDSCLNVFTYPVSDVNATFYMMGSPAKPDIICIIPLKDQDIVLEFHNITSKNLEKLVFVISQISIEDKFYNAPAALVEPAGSLYELIKLKK